MTINAKKNQSDFFAFIDENLYRDNQQCHRDS